MVSKNDVNLVQRATSHPSHDTPGPAKMLWNKVAPRVKPQTSTHASNTARRTNRKVRACRLRLREMNKLKVESLMGRTVRQRVGIVNHCTMYCSKPIASGITKRLQQPSSVPVPAEFGSGVGVAACWHASVVVSFEAPAVMVTCALRSVSEGRTP